MGVNGVCICRESAGTEISRQGTYPLLRNFRHLHQCDVHGIVREGGGDTACPSSDDDYWWGGGPKIGFSWCDYTIVLQNIRKIT